MNDFSAAEKHGTVTVKKSLFFSGARKWSLRNGDIGSSYGGYGPMLMRLFPVVLYLGWFLNFCLNDGRLPYIPDIWSFPYDFSSLSYGDIIKYFNRQPPGYMLFGKLIHSITEGTRLSFEQAIVLTNGAGFGVVLWCFQSLLLRYVSPVWAFLVTCFMAVGMEFGLYVLFVRYEFATMFWVLMLLYTHSRAFSSRYTGHRGVWMVGSLAAVLVLMLTRSFYVYFGFVYFAFWCICVWRHFINVPVGLRRAIVLLVTLMVSLGVPLALMTKNHDVYGHFSLSFWEYESQQRNVYRQIRNGAVSVDVKTFIKQHKALPQLTRKLYATGLEWPTTRRAVRRLMRGKRNTRLFKLVHKAFQADPSIPKKLGRETHLYHHLKSSNGFIYVPLLQEGARVSRALFIRHWREMLVGFFKDGSPKALCYSAYFFERRYGGSFCGKSHSVRELLNKRGPVIPPKTKIDYMKAAIRYIEWYGSYVPALVTSMHILLHQKLMFLVVGLGFVLLMMTSIRLLMRRRFDTLLALSSALVVYSYLVGVLGDYHEAARYSIYWKLPAVLLAVYLFSRVGRFVLRLGKVILLRRIGI